MAALSTDFLGIISPNPFWMASAPPTDKQYNVRRVFDAGWSGERASPRAVAARVHTAMYTLRRLGLRGVIIRRDSGYAIDPRVEIRIGGALM